MAKRAQWGSRLGFILAAGGSAVGLGNIWKFPYITGENGGGLFVLIYLGCIALIGLPILMAEVMIGRAGQRQPVGAFENIQGRPTRWSLIGWLGVGSGFIILSFYVVVAGWSMDYTLKSVVDSSKSIRQSAHAESVAYRGATSIEDMRTMLIERDVAHAEREATADLRRGLKKSVVEDYELFTAALAEAAQARSPRDPAAVRRQLLLDEDMRNAVNTYEALLPSVEKAGVAARSEATERRAPFADEQIAEEAEGVIRRASLAEGIGGSFNALLTDGWTSMFWAAIFMLVTIFVVSRGIAGGIEKTCRVLMPTLIALMVLMVLWGTTLPGFARAFEFVFSPDASKLSAEGALTALGHAFFTLSLGMGALITYGSYQRTGAGGILPESACIALLDTFVALLACLMIFPIIFSFDQEPGAGPGLVFISMPLAFAEMGAGGLLLSIVFFGLLVVAALTSSISLLEVVSSYFIDQKNWSRPTAAWTVGGTVFALSIPVAFANDPDSLMSGWTESYGGISFFDALDLLSANWMLPLGGLLIAIYAGWVMPKRVRDAELADVASPLILGWLVLIRFLAPALVVLVLLQSAGIVDFGELLG